MSIIGSCELLPVSGSVAAIVVVVAGSVVVVVWWSWSSRPVGRRR